VGGEVDTLLGTRHDGTLPGRSTRGGCALTLGAFPEAAVDSFAIEIKSGTSPTLPAQLEACSCLKAGWKVAVVLSCGRGTNRMQQAVQVLQAAHPEAAIIGGLATGDWLLRAHEHKVKVLRHGIVGLLFRGNVPLTALVCKAADTTMRLQHARREVEGEGKALLGGLMFTCTARDAAADAQGFATVFPTTPLAGMPCNGEVGPRVNATAPASSSRDATQPVRATGAGGATLQGFTAVYGLFAAPVRTREVCSVFYQDVGAAYAEKRAQPEIVAISAAATAAAAHRAAMLKDTEEEGDDDDDDDDEESDDDAMMDYGSEEEEEGYESYYDDDDGEEDEEGEEEGGMITIS